MQHQETQPTSHRVTASRPRAEHSRDHVEVLALGGVPHRSAVKGAVEELILVDIRGCRLIGCHARPTAELTKRPILPLPPCTFGPV
jgi:hypothetical protein